MTQTQHDVPQPFRDGGPQSPFDRLKARWLFLALAGAGLIAGLALHASSMRGVVTLDAREGAVLGYLGIALVIALAMRVAGVSWRRLFGPPPTQEMLPLAAVMVPVALLTFAAAIAVYVPLSYVAPQLVERLILRPHDLTTVRTLGEWCMLLLTGVVAAPVVEELVFRGILMHRWARRWGTTTGVIGSSALFAMMHSEWIGHFLVGVALCALYLRTGSLWLPIVAHALNNLVFLSPSIAQALGGPPEPVQTMAELRASAPWIVPLLAAGLLGGWYYLRRWWPDGMLRRVLQGVVPYERVASSE